MPKTFTTTFGSSVHGFFLEWTHDPSVADASKKLTCKMTGNLHADLLTASNIITDAYLVAPRLQYAFTEASYNTFTAPVTPAPLQKVTFGTTTAQYTATYTGSSPIPTTTSVAWPMIEWLVILEDKSTTCSTVCKDGWRAVSDVKIVYDSTLSSASSKIDKFISNWQTQNGGSVTFDIRPTTAFAYSAEDPPTTATDNVTQTDGTSANLCKENWLVSGNTAATGTATIYGYACVQY